MSDKEAIALQNAVEESKSSFGGFSLPCGFLGDDGNLYTELEAREITGVEEDIMVSNSLSGPQKITRVLTNCITRLGPFTGAGLAGVVPRLLSGDRVYTLVGLRRISLGDTYPVEMRCPNPQCKKLDYYELDLANLEIRKMPDPKKRLHALSLSNGVQVTFRCLDGLDEERVAKLNMPNEVATLNLLLRIESYNGSPPALETIQNLGLRDRNAIRDAIEATEGGVDTSLEFTCKFCGTDFASDVDMMQRGFFSPSATRKALKKKYSSSWSGSREPTKR